MQTAGLLGGMSWESTTTYYQLINRGIRDRLGGLHSGKILMYSVDFAEIEELQAGNRWTEAGNLLGEAGRRLEKAGADFIMICTNTMHKVAGQVEECLSIPLVHLADATGERIIEDGISAVGLLGTRFTMEQDFYKGRLERKYGLKVIVPKEHHRNLVHQVIYEELCLGRIRDASREAFRQIITDFGDSGAEGVILGCTEIPLLVRPEDNVLPLYDTTRLHAEMAVEIMISG